MSRSNDPGHYFQTSDSLATSQRKAAKSKNKHGSPIKLPSKILALAADPSNPTSSIYVAEAAGEVKHVNIETSTTTRLPLTATAPLTSLTISPQTKTLYAGSWDKSIHRTLLDASSLSPKLAPLAAHTDFVKTLLATTLNSTPILISGGADATIIIWDLRTDKILHKLKGPAKSIQDLAVDPLSVSESGDSFVLFAASSDREIRRWSVSRNECHEIFGDGGEVIRHHETSVYRLKFDSEGDLWTASADKTVKRAVRARGWEVDTALAHPDFVRDLVVLEERGVVVTACRDEGVRVWDLAKGEVVCEYQGHFEEVTALVEVGGKVVSGSIDGTVRSWGVGEAEMQEYLRLVKEGEGEEEVQKEGMLTAEEEAELAELMDDDD